MPDDATKRCSKCGEVKPLSEFAHRSVSPDGHSPKCRRCTSAWAKAYARENREVILAQRRDSYQERRDILLGRMQSYREEHRDIIAAQERERRASIRAQVFAHYGDACACCGTAERLTIDHVNGDGAQHRLELFGDPQGASATQFYFWLIQNGFPAGFQVLCRPCNISKRRGERCRINH